MKSYGFCEVCGESEWLVCYEGPVRDGSFGSYKDGVVAKCAGCGVLRLEESACMPAVAYESEEYRNAMRQGLEVADFYAHADSGQITNMSAFWPLDIRDKVIADIGCGAGSFLSYVTGAAKKVIAVEPTLMYHHALREMGCEVYSYASEALDEYAGKIDFVFSFQVIEHVLSPRVFMRDVSALLKKGGGVIIATPNRCDIMMQLLPESFPSFFYRSAHRWYFDKNSLRRCVELSGLTVVAEKYIHSLGMSNSLLWMKYHEPKGRARLRGIDGNADKLWASYLEMTGQSDNVFLYAKKA